MKLLIVDDEKLTRDGLLSSVNWKKCNIDELLIAENGLQGLEIAKKQHPEIILSDIRMPKLDGIQMAEQLQHILPNTSIIFMSGYSDKQYLKAAIKLKAISYVEKPIDPAEIEDAIKRAIKENQTHTLTQSSIELHNLNQTTQLALRLTYPPQTEDATLDYLFNNLNLDNYKSYYFTTIILKFMNILPVDDRMHPFYDVLDETSNYCNARNIQELHAFKHDTHIIYHLFYPKQLSTRTLDEVSTYLQGAFRAYDNYFVILGKTVLGYQQVFHSYSSAVYLTPKTFFAEYFSIITEETFTSNNELINIDLAFEFTSALSDINQCESLNIANTIYENLRKCTHLLPLQVKDIYYKLFMTIQTHYKKHQLNLNIIGSDADSILGFVEPCSTLSELHQKLIEKTKTFFIDLEQHQPENPTIYAMKEFIGLHYSDDLLSVKDIASYVSLTTSYVCTLFKSETGQTLNQYITDYRIQKAKDLLLDSRYKITDISAKVGYSDGNYFGKSFKKAVGLSPSEFRERMLL